MFPVEDIDRIYYDKDQEISNNGSETLDGIRIYIDSKTSGDSPYYRWTYNEWWKTSAPDPKKYNYINDTTIIAVDTGKSNMLEA